MLTTVDRQRNPTLRRIARTTGWYIVATVLLLAFLAPLGSALTVALTRTADLFSGSSTPLFPTNPTLEHFRAVWDQVPYLRWYGNSAMVATLFTLGQLTSCSLTAYALARIPFFGRTALLVVIVVTMMLPFQALMIPLFVLFSRIGWIDTLYPLWVPSFFGDITAAFGIFFLRQAFMQIPRDLPEAALIDGANHGQILTRVYLPLVKPQLAVVGVLAFMASWNDFIRPIVYITSPDNMTVTGGLGYFQTAFNVQWGPLMTGSMLSMIPILLLYLAVQRLFVRTLVSSGVKG